MRPLAQDSGPLEGLMMDFQLTTTHLFEHGVGCFPEQQIVTQQDDGSLSRYQFSDYGRRTRRLASALQRRGVLRSERVATFSWNNRQHLECYFAVPGIGAVLHTLNPRLFPEDLAFVINDAEDRVIVCERSLLPLLQRISGRLASVQLLVLFGEGPEPEAGLPPSIDYEELLEEGSPEFEWPQLDERWAAAMCYTSGTTDRPKGVLYSHRSSVLHSISAAFAGWVGLNLRDTLLPVVPMFHVNAWGLPLAAVATGSKLVLPGRLLDPEHLLALLSKEEVTVAAGVPTIWSGLLELLDRRPTQLPHSRMFLCGGSAAPRALIAGFDRHGLTMVHAWGMTETSPVGTVSVLKPNLLRAGASEQLDYRAKQGLPSLGVEVRLIDLDSGAPCPPDGTSSGELQVRGPWIARAYYHDPDDMEHHFTDDGWLRTGDVATLDSEGYVQIVDRTKDLIKSGGEWISSVLLEGQLMAHPKVREAAVVGFPHPRWSERPVAFVVAKPEYKDELSPEELLDFLRPRVAPYWLPDQVIFLEEVPKTSVGKFDKKRLRREHTVDLSSS